MPTTEEILDKLERERQAREQQIAKRQPILAPIEQKPVLMGQPMVQPTGPDIQAMPAPMMPIPTLQPPPIDNGPSPLGQALGGLAGAGASFGLKKLFASKPAADPAYQINKPKLEIPSNIGGMVPPSHVNPLPDLGGAPGEFSALKAAPKVAPVGGGGIGGTISKVGKIFGFEGGGTWAELKKALQQGPVEVGESGPEIIDKNAGVIPAPETRQLLRKVAPDPNYTPGAFPSMQSNGSNEFAGETAPQLKMVAPRFSQQQDQTGQQSGLLPIDEQASLLSDRGIKRVAPLNSQPDGQQGQSLVQPINRDAETSSTDERWNQMSQAMQNPRSQRNDPRVSYAGARALEVNNTYPDGPDNVSPDQRARIGAMSQNIGKLPAELSGDGLGNWAAGAMRKEAERSGGSVDFAILNRSGLRKPSLPAGDVSEASIYETMPFDNKLVIADVKGKDLGAFLGRNGRAMAVDGDTSKMDPNQTYSVAMPDYVINRGGRQGLQGATNVRPVGVARDALMDSVRGSSSDGSTAGASTAPASTGSPSASTPATTPNPHQAAIDARRAELEKEWVELHNLENTKAVDKNGRLKSGFLGALQGFLGGGGLVGAVAGGVRGAVQKNWDEELKQAKEVRRRGAVLDRALKIEREFAQLDALDTRATANAQKAPTQARSAAKQRLQIRARQNGGTLDPNDSETQADLALIGISNLPGPKRKGINAAAIQQSRYDNNFYYPTFDDKQGKYVMRRLDLESGEMQPLTEGERQRLDYERLENNRRTADFVAKYGREAAEAAGMKIIPDPNEEGGAPSSAPGPQPSAQQPAPAAAPEVAPPSKVKPVGTSAIPPNLYVGPPVGRGRGVARHGRGGGSGRGDSIGENLKQRDVARYQSEKAQAEAQAVAAEQRGDDATAGAYRNAANVAQQNIDNLGGGAPARGGRGLGAQSISGGLGAAGTPRQYTAAEIRAQASSEGKDPEAAVRFARAKGRLKR
jgi:hypothetical protein